MVKILSLALLFREQSTESNYLSRMMQNFEGGLEFRRCNLGYLFRSANEMSLVGKKNNLKEISNSLFASVVESIVVFVFGKFSPKQYENSK